MRLPKLLLIALPAALAAMLAAGIASAAPAPADSVVLRDTARVVPGAAVTLADIADLKGEEAGRLAGIEIARGASTAFEITKETVREKLAASGATGQTLRLSGERVVVRPARAATTVPAADADASRPAHTPLVKKPESIDAARHAGAGTPLGIVCELLRNAFGADAEGLRVLISAEDLATLAPKPGFRYEISARSAIKSDFVSFEVAAIDGDEHVSRKRIRVSVRLLREVCVATAGSRRGQPLETGSFRVETREVAPSIAARAADPKAVDGASFARSVDAGLVIAADDLARAAAIRRNDRVIVRREVGLVAIELEAVALEDGKPGDRIALQRSGVPRSRGARTRAEGESGTFIAEVVGSGRAVVR